tara:strand:- start:41 stop:610 length:570 start_codon:yes stop_codon:yes gene_type:complete
MFTKQEWKQNLLGCLEIFLFMPNGVERFSNTRGDAIKSFIIPLALLPIVMAVMVAMSAGFSITTLLSLHLIRMIVTIALFLSVVYFLSKQFERNQYFHRFLIVSNWSNIPGMIMTLPILAALIFGYDMAELESYAIFITIVGYVYSAFIITHCFRLPWEMGGFIAIVGLAIDQNLLDLTVYVRDMVAVV